MIIKFIVASVGIIIALGIAAFWYEIKNAPTADEKEPFLWDDYKE